MILVTGGEGYLGGRIVDYLASGGLQVRVGGRVEKKGVVKIDLADQKSLEKACKGVECIIHLAAMNAPDCEKSPENALLSNGLGTLKLINAAIKEGVKKFIYFSTSHVYGSSLVGIVGEKTLTRPVNHYSITHKIAEDYLMLETSRGAITGTVLRLTNAVGYPKSKRANCWMLFVNNICKQVVETKKIKIKSDPLIKKDFIPISAVCSLISFVMDKDLNNEVFNISSGALLSLNDMALLVQKRARSVLNFTPEIIFSNDFENNQNDLLEISSKKLKSFGFDAELDLSNEIDELLLNCREWFGAE
jgi:UDP-glucose 4-epimerase